MARILFFTDLHNSSEAIKSIKKKISKFHPNLLVCAGDLATFGMNLNETLEKMNFGIPMLIIPGNHETPLQIEKAGKKFRFLRNIHEKSFIFENFKFLGFGGSNQTPFNTPYEMHESEIRKKLLGLGRIIDGKKIILVTHVPPYGTKLDRIDSSHVGSRELRKFIEKYQPFMNVCGHIHENETLSASIKKTRIINPGPEGKIMDL